MSVLTFIEITKTANAGLFGDWFALLVLTAIAAIIVARFSGPRNIPSEQVPEVETKRQSFSRFNPSLPLRRKLQPSPAKASTPSPTPVRHLDPWLRLTKVIDTAANKSAKIDRYHNNAKVQLGAAELSLKSMLAEIGAVMPLPIDPAQQLRNLAEAAAAPAQQSIAA